MAITRLFKKKDDTGLYAFISEIKDLNIFINKKIGKNKEPSLEDVGHVIKSVKRLYLEGIELEKKLKELSNNTKKYDFHYKILTEKMNELKVLHNKVNEFEKSLDKYKKIGDTENE